MNIGFTDVSYIFFSSIFGLKRYINIFIFHFSFDML